MKNVDKIIKEASSNVTVENEKLNKQELLLIKEALLNPEKSFLRTIYDMVKENGKRNKRK